MLSAAQERVLQVLFGCNIQDDDDHQSSSSSSSFVCKRNVFFSGSAGSGKSFLLDTIIERLKQKYGPIKFHEKVCVTATTGIAATHIGGQTLNAALGLGIVDKRQDFYKVSRYAHVRKRIRAWDVLIVDECSMMSAEFFMLMEDMLRGIRGNNLPAGGIQLIFSGDFFQLPPVCKGVVKAGTPEDAFLNHGLAFTAPAWTKCDFYHVILDRVFRQSDTRFVEALNAIREARNTGKAARNALRWIIRSTLANAPEEIEKESKSVQRDTKKIIPTQIFSRNKDVEDINERELAKLLKDLPDVTLDSHLYDAMDCVIPDVNLEQDLTHLNANAHSLRKGKMKQRTLDQWTTGGGAQNEEHHHQVHDRRDKAWKTAKERLMRSDFFSRDCLAQGKIRLCVGAQVMLVKNLDPSNGLVNGSRGSVVGFRPISDGNMMGMGQQHVYPVVQFMNGKELLIKPVKFTAHMHGVGECVRLQVPLKLAWAVTVHKSQGMTLDCAKVSLASMFAPGQAYVALSRVRSIEGLEIVDWDLDCIIPNQTVIDFYDRIDNSSGVLFSDAAYAENGDGEEEEDGTHPKWREYLSKRAQSAAASTTASVF